MSTYTNSIPAGGIAYLPGGNMFTLLAASATLDVILLRNGRIVEKGVSVSPGYFQIPPRAPDTLAFDQIRLEGVAGTTFSAEISAGEGGTNALGGNIVVSNADSQPIPVYQAEIGVISDKGHVIGQQGAVAAQYSYVGILNPAASGVTVKVHRIRGRIENVAAVQRMDMYGGTEAQFIASTLTNLATIPFQHLIDGAAQSLASDGYRGASASVYGTAGVFLMGLEGEHDGLGTFFDLDLGNNPLVLAPGYGFFSRPDGTNLALKAHFEITEHTV